MMSPYRVTIKTAIWILGCSAAPGFALQAMSDGEMSRVSGQDGLSISFDVQNPGYEEISWASDSAGVTWGSMATYNVGTTTPYSGASFQLDTAIDAGTSGGQNLIWLDLQATIPYHRLYAGSFSTFAFPGSSNGEIAIDSGGTISYAGPLVTDATDGNMSSMSFDMVPSSLYYRQGTAGSPEWNMDNLEVDFDLPAFNLNIESDGLTVSAPTATVKLLADYSYDPGGDSPFSITGADRPTITSGWQGGLTDFNVRLGSGGSWTGGDAGLASRSEGFNMGLQWNFGPTFQWVLGETDDPNAAPAKGATVLFTNWQSMHPGAGYAFNFPNITIDPVNSGQGPGGLCWLGPVNQISGGACSSGGTPVDVPVENGGLAVLIRDAHLGAYSSSVTIQDDVNGNGVYANGASGDSVDEVWSRNWGLVYTLGDADINFILYPGGGIANTLGGGATAPGLKMDMVAKIQSRARDWYDKDGDGNTTEILGPDLTSNDAYTDYVYGTHFMIADTDTNLAIGFHSADLLYAANDLYISVLDSGLQFRTSEGRFQFKGRFGGGAFPDLSTDYVAGFDLNVNMEFNNNSYFTLAGSPVGEQALQYFAVLNFTDLDTAIAENSTSADTTANELNDDDGSYVSVSEVGNPAVDFRAARISGRLEVKNGSLSLESTAENSTSDPAKLIISHDLLFGATSAGGNPFTIGRVEFGDLNLGSVVVPSGQWHATMAFKCQTTGGTCN